MKGKYGDSIRASTNTVYQTIKYALSPLWLTPQPANARLRGERAA